MMKRRAGALLILAALGPIACRSEQPQPTVQPTVEATEEATDQPTQPPTEEATQEPLAIEEGTLYVAIIWHQHQPVYYQDPETGIYERPWVRVHATKDYLDMATTVAQYPNIHATFNITPSLIRQLDDFNAGARDQYWVISEKNAAELTDEDKQYLVERLFDTNPEIIERFPRYQELSQQRDSALETWEEQDYRDLQVLFNLAWMDPDWLAEEPLASLAAKERDYAEEDKALIFAETERILAEVIPYHAQLQEQGQIEVTMTPFAHPILPLLVDSNLASIALPDAELPPRFTYGQDAQAQVKLGVQFYEEHFGMAPRGMWPAEGSVAQLIVSMVAEAGIDWMASDEEVLAESLPDVEAFTRNGEDTVQQADGLYRPYTVTGRGGSVAILFRDHLISDKVGFEYSGMDGQAAADDFIQRLTNIREQLEAEGAEGPNLVTVLLDGENAWEYYENDGKEFLHALYQGLSEAEGIRTVTPSEYLAATEAPREIEALWPGSWIEHSYSTWIGEEEENQGWTYLLQTRQALRDAIADGDLTQEQIDEAMLAMYIAEGSDWFWWYGADQNSGNDDAFDRQFRAYLVRVYELIGREAPAFVSVPIIQQQALEPDQPDTGLATGIQADGTASPGEWDTAGYYELSDPRLSRLYYAFDEETIYLRLDSPRDFAEWGNTESKLGFYFRIPEGGSASAFARNEDIQLGFGAHRLLELDFAADLPNLMLWYMANSDGVWEPTQVEMKGFFIGQNPDGGSTLEMAVPLEQLNAAGSANRITMRVVVAEPGQETVILPSAGTAQAVVPDLPLPNVVFDVSDPLDDDTGPGTYAYPTDTVFSGGVFDLAGMQVGYDDEEVLFRVSINGPVRNVWNSPNGLSVQTVDIYIDVDGPENGSRMLLPGRNAALTPDFGWDYAIWAEGWTPGVFQPSAQGPIEVDTVLEISTNPAQQQVTISIPRDLIPGDPATWSIAVALLGQEGFPASGVWRVRDVNANAEQWRFGGAPGDTNHTRIVDILWPEGNTPTQEALLGTYSGSQDDVDGLGPDDFPQVGMIRPD